MNLNFVENFARIRVYPTDVQIFLFSLFLTHSGDIEISIGLKWINELLDQLGVMENKHSKASIIKESIFWLWNSH